MKKPAAIFDEWLTPSNECNKSVFNIQIIKQRIDNRYPICTNLMWFMNDCFHSGYYDVYLRDKKGNAKLLQDLTDKHLRPEHDVFKMWRAGCFEVE